MSTMALLLRLGAPLQSWGTQSRFSERDTQLEPSKSGVVALLCAALGLERTAPAVCTPGGEAVTLDDLSALGMAVRVDREGTKMRDYHTIGGGEAPDWFCEVHGMKRGRDGRFAYGVSKANGSSPETALSNRHYLSDARFLVALGATTDDQQALLRACAAALRDPVFPLFLGRKSFVPAEPILGPPGQEFAQGETLKQILEDQPWEPADHDKRWDPNTRQRAPRVPHLRLVLEASESDGFPRADVPLSFEKGKRRFATRYVRSEFTTAPITRWIQEHSKESVA